MKGITTSDENEKRKKMLAGLEKQLQYDTTTLDRI